jgi:hypothetical protein
VGVYLYPPPQKEPLGGFPPDKSGVKPLEAGHRPDKFGGGL